MAGSGTNRLVQSENAIQNASESALTKALENANEEAIRGSSSKNRKNVSKKESNE